MTTTTAMATLLGVSILMVGTATSTPTKLALRASPPMRCGRKPNRVSTNKCFRFTTVVIRCPSAKSAHLQGPRSGSRSWVLGTLPFCLAPGILRGPTSTSTSLSNSVVETFTWWLLHRVEIIRGSRSPGRRGEIDCLHTECGGCSERICMNY